MPRPARRREKSPRLYDILIVSLGEGSKTRKFRASKLTVVLAVLGAFLLSVMITLVVLMFTPVAMYVPLPSPLLEEKYGRPKVDEFLKLRHENKNMSAQDHLEVAARYKKKVEDLGGWA